MKKMNKLLALVLAMVMVLGLATVASAATVTVPSDGILKDHTFTAYQIFSGREEGGVLSDVEWGEGINSTAFLAALKNLGTEENKPFAACETAEAVAEVLSANNSDKTLANQVAKLAYTHKSDSGIVLTSGENALADGYYLVVDTTENVAAGSAYNASLLQVVGNIEINVKTDAPSVEKKVWEDDKYSGTDYGAGYNDVADHNMGDAVPFHLIGSVPDMSRYDTYKYIFHDTLSNGLTAPAKENVKVYLSADKVLDTNSDSDVTSNFTIEVTGQKITVSCNNLKAVVGETGAKYVIVAYTATLNQNAVVGLDGNPNVVYLEYSNKPDQSGSGDTNNTGKTPEDKVIVFTYELETTKISGTEYTKAPDGTDPDKIDEDGYLLDDNGNKIPLKLQGAEFKLHNANNKWAIVNADNKVTGWADTEEGGTTLTSGANGLFEVIGLDDGTYYLKETKAPTGYNLLTSEITVVITATTTNGQTWTNGVASSALTALTVKVDNEAETDGDLSNGTVGITVKNNKGSTLPETGGIGTTIFYVLGGMLVVCAVVLMVSKKRMSAEG